MTITINGGEMLRVVMYKDLNQINENISIDVGDMYL